VDTVSVDSAAVVSVGVVSVAVVASGACTASEGVSVVCSNCLLILFNILGGAYFESIL